MPDRLIRHATLAFDARTSSLKADVTLAAKAEPIERRISVAGHRSWSPQQIVSALQRSLTWIDEQGGALVDELRGLSHDRF